MPFLSEQEIDSSNSSGQFLAEEDVAPDTSTSGALKVAAAQTAGRAPGALGSYTQNMMAFFPAAFSGVGGMATAAGKGVYDTIMNSVNAGQWTPSGEPATDAFERYFNKTYGELTHADIPAEDKAVVDKALEVTMLPVSVPGKVLGAGLKEAGQLVGGEQGANVGEFVGEVGGQLAGTVLGGIGLKKAANTAIRPLEINQRAKRLAKQTEAAEASGLPQVAPAVGGKNTLIEGITPPIPTSRNRRQERQRARDIEKDIAKKQAEQQTFNQTIAEERKATVEADRVVPETPTEPVSNVVLSDPTQIDFINNKVKELGSVEKVREQYKTDSAVDTYARELANNLFTKEELTDGKVQAETKAEVTEEKPSVQNLNKEALSPEELVRLDKEGYFTPEEIAAIQKMPAFKQREQYNRTFGITDVVQESPEVVAKAVAVANRVREMAANTAQVKADRATLKGAEWTDADIAKAEQEGNLARYAATARGEQYGVKPLTDLDVSKLTDVEQKTRALADRLAKGEEVPEAELDAVMKDVVDTNIPEIAQRPSPFDVDPELSYSEYKRRLASLRGMMTDVVRNRRQATELTAVDKRRRRKVEAEVEKIITEETPVEVAPEEQKVSTTERNRRDRVATKAENAGDIVDWEAKLAEEGMPAELNFGEGQEKRSLASIVKLETDNRRVKREFDTILQSRNTFLSNRDARDTLVKGYKYKPKDYAAGLAQLEQLKKAEAMSEGMIRAPRNAFNMKQIAKAVANKDITPEHRKYIEAVIQSLKDQPTFEFQFDPKMKGREGVYYLADNLLQLKDPKASAHEVLHWAFYNVLTGQERLAYYQDHLNQFYSKDTGGYKTIKAMMSTSDPYNAMKSPAEMFAARGSDVFNQYKLTPVERSLFQKAFDWFRNLMNKLGSRGKVKLEKVDELYNKVFDDSQRKDWTEAEEASFKAPEYGEALATDKGSITMDMLGLQSIYERIAEMVKTHKGANRPTAGKEILAEVKGPGWDFGTTRDRQVIGQPTNSVWRQFKDKVVPMSPTFFTEGGKLDRHVYNLNRSEQYIAYKFDEHQTTLRDAIHGLSEQEQRNVTSILRGNREAMSQAEIDAVAKTRNWLDMMRDRYKIHLKNEYKVELNNTEYNALLDVISGTDLNVIKAKYPKLSTEVIESIADRYKEIDNWGLDDYITNVERGQYRIMTDAIAKDGDHYKKLVGVGLSRKDATRKAVRYLEDHPEAGDMFIDTGYARQYGDKTTVTHGQYYAMMHDLAKKIKVDLEVINSEAKAMAQKTLSRKFTIAPTDAYSEFLEPRKDILKGEENVFPVLESYAYSMEKKMALDPTIDLVRADFKNLSKAEREYITTLIDDVNGKNGQFDQWMNEVVDIFGSNRGYDRLIGKARTLEANLKLGYRPIAAAINFASGQLHTMIKTGVPIYVKGVRLLQTPEGRALIDEVRPYLGTTLAIEQSVKSQTPLWKPLGLFQAVEPINREVCFLSNYLYAKEKLGKSEAAAKEFGLRANWAQQFTYNVANLPNIMRGSTGRLLTQFKPYLVKELEFMHGLTGSEWIGYTAMQLALGGPRAFVMILKSLPILAMMPWWDDAMDYAEEWMNKNVPIASRGAGALPGLIKPELGMDISAAASFQFPSEVTDFVGPFLSDIYKLGKDVFIPMTTYGPSAQDTKKAANVAPIAKHWLRTFDYAVSKDNWLKDNNGNKLYEVPSALPFIIQSVAGVENIDLNRIRAEEGILTRRDERTHGLITRLTNQAMQYVLDGEPMPNEFVDRLVKNGVTGEALLRRVEQSQYTPEQRRILRTEIRRRPEVIEMFPNSADFD